MIKATVPSEKMPANRRGSLRTACRVTPGIVLVVVAVAAIFNAWTFSYATSVPLVQSDAWIFLDTYVRKYLEGNFAWRDLFLQTHSGDTNLPLHKLILMFHINHFHMDFKVEGLIGVASGIGLVVLLTVAATGRHPSRWSLPGYALLAWLALVTLSLNSSNVYTWPLATMWFLNILVVAVYLVFMARSTAGPWSTALATVVLGILMDEVALIGVSSALVALLLVRDARPLRERMVQAAAAAAGLVLVRGLYAVFNAVHGVSPDPAAGAGLLQGLIGLVTSDGLQLVLLPLGDSLIHIHPRQEWYPQAHAVVGNSIGAALLLAHIGFWWAALRRRAPRLPAEVQVRRIAVALMLLFYGTVAGIALQRVPVFGIEYLHQPRYVLFYQLNLAALGLMAYSFFGQWAPRAAHYRLAGGALLAALLSVGLLQWYLGVRSWEQAKYLSVYVEGAAKTMGRLAIDPGADVPCADILRVCDFPPEQRRRMMDLLLNYRLNLFNPDFQARYRLRPYPQAVQDAPMPRQGSAEGYMTGANP
jgi:hypothetical protein